jgi:clan AA aspartic protease (TIGR02281 family)
MRSLIALTIAMAAILPAYADDDCQLKRYGTVTFEVAPNGHIYVPATVAGVTTRLLLDTGAYWSSVSSALVKAKGLLVKKSHFLELVDLAGKKQDQLAVVPSVQIGNSRFGETEMFVDTSQPDVSIEEEGGVIGQNLLNQIDLEIDNAGKKISFFSQDHCPGVGVYWADEAVTLKVKKAPIEKQLGSRLKPKVDARNVIDPPAVEAEVNGETVQLLFDTGATHTVIDFGLAQRRFGITKKTPGILPAGKIYTAGGVALDAYRATLKTLTVSGISFENVPVYLAEFEGDGPHVLLGMSQLKHLRLYIAYKEGLIHVTAADATRAATPAQQ